MQDLKKFFQKTEIFLNKNYRWIVFGIMAFFLVVSILNAKNDSATFDEVAHIPAGYTYLTEHEMRLNPEHPPILKDLAAFPLLFLNLNFDNTQSFWTGGMDNKWDAGQWAAGRHLLYGAGNDPDQIIFWSRIPIILLAAALGLFIFRWVSHIGGRIAGLFALTLFAFDPNILGHNHYVTTDIGIAAFLTFAFYYYIKFIKKPSWKNVGLAGLFLGFLQLAKFSSLTAFPIFALITLIYPFVRKEKYEDSQKLSFKLKNLAQYVGKGALVFAISLIVVWFVYALNTFNTSQETMAEAIDFNFSLTDTNPKNVYTNKTLHFLNEYSITRPLAEYGIGIGYVFRRVAGGNGAYFLGEVSSNAFPTYFPTVFLIKETIPFLILILIAAGFTIYQLYKSIFRRRKIFFKESLQEIFHYLRTGITFYAIFGFIILYAYLSITGNLNIGFRHLFPILPFIYILIAKKTRELIKRQSKEKIKLSLKLLLAILVIWLVTEPLANYPVYVSYFNQFAGGPKNGYKYVTDSNADWGQDLKRLQVWLDKQNKLAGTKKCHSSFSKEICEKPIKKIRVDYFGGGDIFHYIGEDRAILWWDSKRPIEEGWYAISTNFRQGSIYSDEKTMQNSYRWTKKYTPVDQVGTSLLIYHIKNSPDM